MIHLVLLSGGSGTRLWPLSNSTRSKQFLKVLRDVDGNHVSMVQRVFGQIGSVDADIDITIATCASQEESIRRQVEGDYALVLEPERRDTAPAIMLACANLALERGAGEGDTVIVMPIDSYADQAYYDSVVRLDEAVQSDFAELVLMGVEPTYPSGKYGYIVPAAGEAWPRRVERFTEKPDEGTARELISQGALWNCGVFAFRLGWLTGLTAKYLECGTFEEFRSRYSELPKNSFDYEVVERASSIGAVSYAGEWKDLGTWNTLTDEMAEFTSGRVVVDSKTCENVHVINETGFPMVVAGISDSVVVATPTASSCPARRRLRTSRPRLTPSPRAAQCTSSAPGASTASSTAASSPTGRRRSRRSSSSERVASSTTSATRIAGRSGRLSPGPARSCWMDWSSRFAPAPSCRSLQERRIRRGRSAAIFM